MTWHNLFRPSEITLVMLTLATLAYALLCGTWLGFLLFILTDQAPGRIE